MTIVAEILLSIAEAISGVLKFIVDFFSDLISFIGGLAEAVSRLTEFATSVFPEPVVVLFVSLLTVTFLMRVLGR